MLLEVADVLDERQVREFRELLLAAQWTDGAVTAGTQSAKAKHNLQLPANSPEAEQIGNAIYAALSANAVFLSAALPARVFPPLFNCYQSGRYFDLHVDNAIRQVPETPVKVRTDLSLTLFFSEPEEYEGGELVVEDTYGSHTVKLPAGHMILYPASSLHRVTPVNSGRRLASFGWVQSLVRSDAQRTLMFELDQTIQQLRKNHGDSPEAVRLTNIYHNLLRRWAEPV
jgi:PKHD-type hydroxylase